mgnify:CR=1 FL=1
MPKYIENSISGRQTAPDPSAHFTNGRGCVDFCGRKEENKCSFMHIDISDYNIYSFIEVYSYS